MKFDDYSGLEDGSRRDTLLRLLSCGTLGLFPFELVEAGWFSSGPDQLEDGKSIHSLVGEALINGKRANLDSRIRTGDRVQTGANSEIIFVVGDDSFILRDNSDMEISGGDFFIDGLRLLSGKLLSVFGKRSSGQRLNMLAPTATIGIRGTGVYMEAEPDLTYLCTCYGQVALAAQDDPNDAELITTTNHDQPRYIASKPVKGSRIRPAPVINHSDAELKLLEAVVGRKVPAGFGKKAYTK